MDSFDRVEDLAQAMAAAAGSDWQAKGTKRLYWRTKAADALASADARSWPLLDGEWEWFVGGALSGALCMLLALLAGGAL